MDKNLDIISYAVSLIIKAAIMAGRFSEKVRRRSLKRLVAMDADTKDKEIIFTKGQDPPAPNASGDPTEANQQAAEKAVLFVTTSWTFVYENSSIIADCNRFSNPYFHWN